MIYNVNKSGLIIIPPVRPIDADLLLTQINAQEVRSLYPLIFFYAAILIVGVIGNALVLIVYTFRYKHSPARVFILFLASIDFSICLFGLPYHLIDLTHPYTFTSSITCKLLTFVITTLFHMSVFGLIVIAIDRYLKICMPLSHLQIAFFRKRRACIGAVIAALLFSWPNIVLYGQSEMESSIENVTGYACYFETKYLDTNYPLIYTLTMLFVCITSTVFLIVAYSMIYLQIYKRYHGFRNINVYKSHMEETSLTEEVNMKSLYKIHHSPKVSKIQTIHIGNNMTVPEHIEEGKSIKDNINYDASGIKSNGSLLCEDINKTNKPCTPTDSDRDKNSESKVKCQDNIEGMPANGNPENRISRETGKSSNSNEMADSERSSDDSENHCKGEMSTENEKDESQQLLVKHNTINGDNNSMNNFLNSSSNSLTVKPFKPLDKISCDVSCSSSSKSVNSSESSSYLTKYSTKYLPMISDCHVKSTGALNTRQRDGFPMCRPQTVKRRSLDQYGSNIISDDYRQRSASLAHTAERCSKSVHICEGLRIHSSSATSVYKTDTSNTTKANKVNHSKITKIMLTVTIVFILSYSPALIVTILTVLKPDIWDIMTVRETIICEFFLRFYLVNNVCNPFIYGFWDKRFLREIRYSLKKLAQRVVETCFCCIDRN